MRRFQLYRLEDETGISGSGSVAQGVEFPDGTCVLRWTTEHTSTAIYETIEKLVAIHGHNGKTVVLWMDDKEWYHGWQDCLQDRCENAPFGSVGGLASRHKMIPPSYVRKEVQGDYLSGYRAAAMAMFGPDWQTCEFVWRETFIINDEEEDNGQEGTREAAEAGHDQDGQDELQNSGKATSLPEPCSLLYLRNGDEDR